MAVVVVMDVSNTMTYAFGSTTRAEVGSRKYDAAMESAATFIDSFAANASDSSRIGYVAFNTDAHQIMQLRSCSADDADIVKKQIQTETNKVLELIEAGLKMADDMLAGAPAQIEDRYIIFLSDGFPTTYIENNYKGYDPYCTSGEPGSDGVFYDSITKKYCHYGTSYSDEAAIRSRRAAESIKAKGTKIFSIGIDIGGQTIEKFVNQTIGKSFSVVDRRSESYEIGDAASAQSYKAWLKNSIGSGFYYDSINSEDLKNAYAQIFTEMKQAKSEIYQACTVTDPMPIAPEGNIEFIGFYDKDANLRKEALQGTHADAAENTARYDIQDKKITWDLKNSGYRRVEEEGGAIDLYRIC